MFGALLAIVFLATAHVTLNGLVIVVFVLSKEVIIVSVAVVGCVYIETVHVVQPAWCCVLNFTSSIFRAAILCFSYMSECL